MEDLPLGFVNGVIPLPEPCYDPIGAKDHEDTLVFSCLSSDITTKIALALGSIKNLRSWRDCVGGRGQ